MEKLLDKLNELWVDAGLKLIYVIAIWFIGAKFIKLLVKLIKKGKLFNKLDKSIASFLLSFINITLYIILIITIASIIGIPSTSIIKSPLSIASRTAVISPSSKNSSPPLSERTRVPSARSKIVRT